MQLQPVSLLGKDEDPTAAGNVGLYIKPDGGVRIFNSFGKSMPSELTAKEIESTHDIFALVVALRVPEIMKTLRAMASDPDVIGVRTN